MNELCRFDRRHIQCGSGNGLDASNCGKILLPTHTSARFISAPLPGRRLASKLSRRSQIVAQYSAFRCHRRFGNDAEPRTRWSKAQETAVPIYHPEIAITEAG